MRESIHTQILMSNAASHWKKFGIKSRHGLCTPVFSLRTRSSTGIGEFLDLLELIHFCKKVNMEVLQILPINDTGDQASPYSAISSMALNPIYLSLYKMKNVQRNEQLRNWLYQLRDLDQAARFNYFEILKIKIKFLEHYFLQESLWIEYKKELQKFTERNLWLDEYALFCILKKKHKNLPWYEWPNSLQKLSLQKRKKLETSYRSEISFYRFVQFLCFLQMEEVKRAAKKAGILIKGDIPILVSKDSVDVWMHQECFLLDKVAGAPPDPFNPQGQNWGFPIYNWPLMKERNFVWWRQRMKVVESIYDLYRIDHAVGFFRIWSIGKTGEAKFGSFIPKNPKSWVEHGKKHMQMLLNSSDLLPIAEDLGKVPMEVRKAIMSMGICGTRVVKNQYHWTKKHYIFSEVDYPEVSMTTLGTHDMQPLALWWRDHPKIALHFAKYLGWKYEKELTCDQLYRLLKFSHQTNSLFHINMLDEYLCLEKEFTTEPLEKRRINVPGTISEKNWSFRMQGELESVTAHNRLIEKVKEICV